MEDMSAPATATTIIHFIRHGENPANITREFSCRRVDYPLTERGIAQARQTAAYLRTRPIAAIYASPLNRAAQTATLLAEPLALHIIIREAFREVDVGELEDAPPTEANWALHDRIFDSWLAGDPDTRFPGGESQRDLERRMRAGLSEVVTAHPGREVVVVAHGGILAATICQICANVRAGDLSDVPNCAITEFALHGRDGALFGHLRAWAARGHLG